MLFRSHLAAWGEQFLRHVHFAQQAGRLCPALDRPDDNYRPFFDALKKAGYDARISCEAYCVDARGTFAEEAGAALQFLRTMTA